MQETKHQKVKRLVRAEFYKEALQICKDWDYENPTHRDILRRGYECLLYADFYRQIKKDPIKGYNDAVNLLKRIYLD